MNETLQKFIDLNLELVEEVDYVKSLLEGTDFNPQTLQEKFTDSKLANVISSKFIHIKKLILELKSNKYAVLLSEVPEANEIIEVLQNIDPNILKKE